MCLATYLAVALQLTTYRTYARQSLLFFAHTRFYGDRMSEDNRDDVVVEINLAHPEGA